MKVVQLNIEREKHLERVVPFLVRERADVVCLQEVYREDLDRLATLFGMESAFAPMTKQRSRTNPTDFEYEGVGILSSLPIRERTVRWYFGDGTTMPPYADEVRDASHQPLLTCTCVLEGGSEVIIGTTHFMKSFHGLADEYQRERMQRFLPILHEARPDLLCGDFNIPRGTELYHVLREHLMDNVPREYVSSIDPVLHRVPGLSLMIDYLWSSVRVRVFDVRMECGISDHCALVGQVKRAE